MFPQQATQTVGNLCVCAMHLNQLGSTLNSEENTELMDPSTNELPAEKEFFFERIPAKVSPIKCEKIRTKSDGCVCQLLAGSFEKYFLIFLNIPAPLKNISSSF